MIIFSGSSHQKLAKDIAELGGFTYGECSCDTFANDEKNIRILTDVENQEVTIVQSFTKPVDSNIIELVLIADALERAGAKEVTAVIPWMGYSLQDKVFQDGQALSARVVADIVSHAFIQKVILMDLHNPSIAGFFSVPTRHLRGLSLFVEYVRETFDLHNSVVVSPDFGGLKQSRVFAQSLDLDLVNVNKHRDLKTGEVSTEGVSGDVNGKVCIVYDDVVNTGGTVVEVAKTLKEMGAKEVHFLVTHGLFAGDGLQKMEHEAIDSIVISDSVYHPQLSEKMHILSIANIILPYLQ